MRISCPLPQKGTFFWALALPCPALQRRWPTSGKKVPFRGFCWLLGSKEVVFPPSCAFPKHRYFSAPLPCLDPPAPPQKILIWVFLVVVRRKKGTFFCPPCPALPSLPAQAREKGTYFRCFCRQAQNRYLFLPPCPFPHG